MANPIYTPANSANDPLNQYKNPTIGLGTTATYPGSNVSTASPALPSSMAQTKPSTYTGSSIVDYLGSTGQANDYASRAKLAQQSGIQNYAGTAEQNTQLLNTLRGSSAPATQTTNTPAPYNQTPATGTTYTGTSPVVTPPPVTPPPTGTPTGQTGLSYDAAQQGLYGQLIADLASRYNQPTQAYTDAMKQYQDINAQLQASKTNEAGQLAANAQNPIPLEFQQGRGQVLQNQFLQQQAALAGQLQGASNVLGQANTQQGLQQQALSTAAGLAAPQQVGYNVQYTNPVTGQPYSGTQAGGSLQTAVSTVADKLKSGTMTYNDALAALIGYGQGGVNALQASLPTGFNIAQSNALGGLQGQIGPAYSFAKTALENLKNVVGQLGIAQGTNIPIVNAIGNLFSTQSGIGGDKTRQYTQAVQEARNAYAQLLASSRGGTPTEYSSQANAAIPDNATPNDINAALSSIESIGQSKVNIYGNPGASTTGITGTNTNSSASGIQYNSDGTLRAVSF